MTISGPEDLHELDRGVLELLLDGDDPVLETLRAQLATSTIRNRELSGVGFFTYFEISDDSPRFAPDLRFEFGDVHAYDERGEPIAGFLIFVREGRISNLEGFCYVGDWPLDEPPYILRYDSEPRDWTSLRRTLRGED